MLAKSRIHGGAQDHGSRACTAMDASVRQHDGVKAGGA